MFQDGSVYKGEWKVGVREGYGILFLGSGERYDGPWSGDRMHGVGVWSTPYGEQEKALASEMDLQERQAWHHISAKYIGEEVTAAREAESDQRREIARQKAEKIQAQMKASLTKAAIAAQARAEEMEKTLLASAGLGAGDVQSEEMQEAIAALRGGALVDPDEEGMSMNADSVQDDVEKAIELSKNNYEGAGLLEWRQEGVWDKVKNQRLQNLALLTSKVSTIEFRKKFPITSKDPVLYISEFAIMPAIFILFYMCSTSRSRPTRSESAAISPNKRRDCLCLTQSSLFKHLRRLFYDSELSTSRQSSLMSYLTEKEKKEMRNKID